MPELPKVSQEFDADVAGYLAGMEKMIKAADAFIAKNAQAIQSVKDLQEAIKDLDGKTIVVNVRYVTQGDLPGGGATTRLIREQVIPAGETGPSAGGMNIGQMQAAADALNREAAAARNAASATNAYDASLEATMTQATRVNNQIERLNNMFGEGSVAAEKMTLAQYRMYNAILSDSLAMEKGKMTAAQFANLMDIITLRTGTAAAEQKAFAAGMEANRQAFNNAAYALQDISVEMRQAEQTTGPWLDSVITTDQALKAGAATMRVYDQAMAENTLGFMHMAGMEAAATRDTQGLTTALTQAANVGRTVAAATRDTSGAMAGAIPLAGALARGWGFFTADIRLWGGLLPGIIGGVRGWHLALDALVEGFIAVAGALLAFTVGAVAVTPAVTDIKDHLTSVYDVSHALGQSIPPITGQFSQLAHALAPQVLVIYGAALSTIQRQTKVLGDTAHSVVNIFENWAVKFQAWAANQNNLGKILQSGTGFLSQFGQIIGNVGAAISNLIKADPGTAHFLLDFFVGATRVLDAVTKLPSPILYAALAFHSIWLWGGLAANGIIGLLAPIKAVSLALGGLTATKIDPNASGLSRLKTTITDIGLGFAQLGKNIGTWARGIGIAMKDAEGFTGTAAAGMNAAFGPLLTTLKGLAANPVTWIVALAVGLGALVYSATQADGATKGLINSINTGLSSMTASKAIFGGLSSDFAQLHTQLNQVNAAWAASTPGISKLGGTWSQAFAAAKHSVDELGHAFGLIGPSANPSLNAITAEITHLTTAQSNLFNTVGYTMKQNGYTFEQTVALMDLAGIKASDTFAQMKLKVDDLVKGFQNMGVQGPLLASAVNAITFATTLADSKVSAITQGFSQFLSVLTGGETTLLTFATGMLGLTQAATNGTTAIRTTNGVTRLTTTALAGAAAQAATTGASMSGLGTSSIALRQAFEQQITAAGNAINSMYTLSTAGAQGTTGMKDITQGTKDYVASLVPFAQGNQAAVVQLMGVAQMAGGPAYSATKSLAQNFQTLTTWVGNIQNPLGQADAIMTKMTTAAGNLAQDVLNLAAAINTNLNTAMAQAVVQAGGGQTAFDNFANAVQGAHGNLQALIPSATGVYNVLVQSLGKGVPQVEQTFKSFAEAGLHLTTDQANTLWNIVTGKLNPGLAGAGTAADNLSKKHLADLQKEIDSVRSHTQSLAGDAGKTLPQAISTAGTAADTFKGAHLSPLNTQTVTNNRALQVYSDMMGSYFPSKASTAGGASNTFKVGGLLPLMNQTNNNKNALSDYSVMLTGKYPAALGTAGTKSQQTAQQPMAILLRVLQDLDKWVQIMAQHFATQWPKTENTNVNVTGSGGANITSNISGVASGRVMIGSVGGRFAGGGIVPGYAPGHDSVHALLSPGEGVLVPQATRMLGGEAGIRAINSSAQHFATGGVVTSVPGVETWAGQTERLATTDITKGFANVLTPAVKNIAKSVAAQLAAMSTKGLPMGFSGATTHSAAVAQAYAASLLSQYGWSAAQMGSLIPLWNQESGWSAYAVNQSSGAYGIPQSLGHGHPYALGDYQNQIIWGLNYIKQRYGSPGNAWAHEMAFNWYDQGGMLPPGLSLAYNGTGQPEKVNGPFGGIDPGGPMILHNHIDVKLDGATVWRATQQNTLRYNVRNSGIPTGVQKPGHF